MLWLFLGISVVAFFIRITIRLYCMRRLVVEDYLMTVTLFGYTATAVIQYVYMGDIYTLYRVEKGLETPTADFPRQMTSALRADGLVVILVSSLRVLELVGNQGYTIVLPFRPVLTQ